VSVWRSRNGCARMWAYPVSKRVNSPKNDDADLIASIDA
jgi:hypothetical protein